MVTTVIIRQHQTYEGTYQSGIGLAGFRAAG